MMRVLVTFDRLQCRAQPADSPLSGGAQRRAFQVARHLAASGAEVFFASDDDGCDSLVRQLAEGGIHHVPVPFRSRGWLGLPVIVWRLAVLLRRERVQVVHAHDRWSAMFAWLAASLAGSRYFYTAHAVFHTLKPTKMFFGHCVTAISKAVKRNLVEYFGLVPGDVEVIYNGESIEPPSEEERRRVLARYRLDADDRVLCCVARLAASKGHACLIEAVGFLKDEFPRLRLLLVGDGDERPRLERMVAARGLEPHVLFCGHQSQVAPFLGVSEFLVLPSLLEGLGAALIESSLLGIPAVASRVGGIPEVVENGVTGLLVEPRAPLALAEAMRLLLRDRELAKRMGGAARVVAKETFSLERMLAGYETYFRARLGPAL